MRSGDEPGHARSPLRLRLALAGFGLLSSLLAAFVVRHVAPRAVVLAFLAVAVLAVADLLLVGRHLRRGAHYQPGPGVPPYRPVEPEPVTRTERAPLSERVRMRRYFAIMAVCLTLFAVAGGVVRLYSTTAAVVLCVLALILPPVAVIVANLGVWPVDQPPADPRNPPGGAPGDPEASPRQGPLDSS